MLAEFPPRPDRGRVVRVERHVGLADVRPDGRARLDALARFLQDVADLDAATAELDGSGVWVLRRLTMRLHHTPRFRADLAIATWCSGTGPRWAERRTDVHVDDACCVEAVALWAHVDAVTGAPAPLPAGFDACWGETASGRRVSARLRHASPPNEGRRDRWPLRAVDLDVLGHVNNAAYWAPVEEELARQRLPVAWAEIEFRSGLDARDVVDVVVGERDDGIALWLCVGDDVRASALIGSHSWRKS